MVCLGNICRSPLAEGILKELVRKNKLDWQVESCGTSSFHNGDLPHEDSIAIAAERGVDITDQRSALFTKSAFENYDHILAMDASNYNDIVRHASTEEQRNKVELILNYSNPGMNQAVPDPYYVGGFDIVYDMIEDACKKFVEKHK